MKSTISVLNMSDKRFTLKIGDIIIYLLIFVICVVLWISLAGNGGTVSVSQNGKLIYEGDLINNEREIKLGGAYENTILIQDGKVKMSHATCPDQVCVHTDAIDENGGVLCCAPNGVVVSTYNNRKEWDVLVR